MVTIPFRAEITQATWIMPSHFAAVLNLVWYKIVTPTQPFLERLVCKPETTSDSWNI